MALYDEFRFKPAPWLPHSNLPLEELERVRNIKREDMEYTNENGFSVRIVMNPELCFVQDMFYRILKSDLEDKPFSMICPNQWPGAYSAVANMLNKFNVSARNVHAFAMDEWADEDGNVDEDAIYDARFEAFTEWLEPFILNLDYKERRGFLEDQMGIELDYSDLEIPYTIEIPQAIVEMAEI